MHEHQFMPGARYPLLYGSAATEVCRCGAWRLVSGLCRFTERGILAGAYHVVDREFYLSREDDDA